MTQMKQGPVLTIPEALELGVFDAAEGLKRDSTDKPWEVVRKCDAPEDVKQDEAAKQYPNEDSKMAKMLGHILSSMGAGGILGGIGDALLDDGKPKMIPGPGDAKPEQKPPSYKDGTDYVPETGPAKLHEGEAVLNREDADDYRSSKGESGGDGHTSLHRALKHLHEGGLHRALGVAEGEKIPADKLEAAKHSDNEHVAHMARFASVLKGFHHGKGK